MVAANALLQSGAMPLAARSLAGSRGRCGSTTACWHHRPAASTPRKVQSCFAANKAAKEHPPRDDSVQGSRSTATAREEWDNMLEEPKMKDGRAIGATLLWCSAVGFGGMMALPRAAVACETPAADAALVVSTDMSAPITEVALVAEEPTFVEMGVDQVGEHSLTSEAVVIATEHVETPVVAEEAGHVEVNIRSAEDHAPTETTVVVASEAPAEVAVAAPEPEVAEPVVVAAAEPVHFPAKPVVVAATEPVDVAPAEPVPATVVPATAQKQDESHHKEVYHLKEGETIPHTKVPQTVPGEVFFVVNCVGAAYAIYSLLQRKQKAAPDAA